MAHSDNEKSFFQAASMQDIAKMEELIQEIDIECKNSVLLSASCTIDGLEVVKFLISNGANTDARTPHDAKTPLHGAAQKGCLDIVKFLIANGAQIEAKTNLNTLTPLHFAVFYGHYDVVKYLVENGAKLCANSKDNQSPLQLARHGGHRFIEDYLTQKIKQNFILGFN